MRIIASFATIASLVLPSTARAQRPVELAPNAPKDEPVNATQMCQLRAMKKAIEPYVTQARATYPSARERFLAGLPPKHTMFVTTRLTDDRGHEEQVFVVVDSIVGNRIVGRIWSDVLVIRQYRLGQRYELTDSALLDWMVARPDGSEEGNVVGKFMDEYRPPSTCKDTP